METCKVCNLRKYKDEQTSTKSFQYAYDWPNVKRRIEYQKSQRRNYFGYKILASKSPDWQIDVDQSIDQLIIIDLSCLLV